MNWDYSTGTLNTSQTLFGSVAWSRKSDFLVDLEGELMPARSV